MQFFSEWACAHVLVCYRALEKLQAINQSQNRKSCYSNLAMITLVNANMSIKYSLTGHLSATDIITDGFYDVGKVFPRGFNNSVSLKKRKSIIFSHCSCFSSGTCRREDPDIGGTGPAARQSAQAHHCYQHVNRVRFLQS